MQKATVVRRLTVGPTGQVNPARDSNPESPDDYLSHRDRNKIYVVDFTIKFYNLHEHFTHNSIYPLDMIWMDAVSGMEEAQFYLF